MNSGKSGLRTVDVARQTGYSVQQVRNLERDGILPLAARTRTGYRAYTLMHVQAALAYRALAAGVGPVDAKRVMRRTNTRRLTCSHSWTPRTRGFTPNVGSLSWRRTRLELLLQSRSRILDRQTR